MFIITDSSYLMSFKESNIVRDERNNVLLHERKFICQTSKELFMILLWAILKTYKIDYWTKSHETL